MKKFIASILAGIMVIFGAGTMSGCSFLDEALDNAIDVELLEDEIEKLEEENKALKEELATLKFELTGIINQDVILNSVNRSIPYGEDGDAIQVIGNSIVTINGGKFNGGQPP